MRSGVAFGGGSLALSKSPSATPALFSASGAASTRFRLSPLVPVPLWLAIRRGLQSAMVGTHGSKRTASWCSFSGCPVFEAISDVAGFILQFTSLVEELRGIQVADRDRVRLCVVDLLAIPARRLVGVAHLADRAGLQSGRAPRSRAGVSR